MSGRGVQPQLQPAVLPAHGVEACSYQVHGSTYEDHTNVLHHSIAGKSAALHQPSLMFCR